MSVNVPLHKWRSADPAILIGRRCIAQTDQRDEENNISRMLISKIAQQGE